LRLLGSFDLSVGGDRCLNRQRCPKQEILGILLIGAFVQRVSLMLKSRGSQGYLQKEPRCHVIKVTAMLKHEKKDREVSESGTIGCLPQRVTVGKFRFMAERACLCLCSGSGQNAEYL